MTEPFDPPSLSHSVPAILGDPPPVLYHYTTREALLGILTSRSVWASSIRHLNDSTELGLASEVLASRLPRHLEAAPSGVHRQLLETFGRFPEVLTFPVPAFVFSMSADPDVLSQWRAYCLPTSAYALGFNSLRLRAATSERGYFLAECLYDPGPQEQLVDKVLEAAIAEYRARESVGTADKVNRGATGVNFFLLMLQAGALIKHSAFRDEKEWRLVRVGAQAPLSFRAGKSMLIPYHEVTLGDTPEELPFDSIVIGPTPHPKQEEDAVNLLENHLRTSTMGVIHSAVPYRSW